MIRARYRNGTDRTELIEPGEVYEYSITLNSTGNCFLPGHSIRVDIRSSDFPNFEATLAIARQTVFHDGPRASRIMLSASRRGGSRRSASGS